jgi:hypothetical protein
MKANKKWGIFSGIIVFLVFMVPWLGFLVYALITDPTGFNAESIIGTSLGVIIFALAASFFGLSIYKKSLPLIVIASLCVVAIPVWWYFVPWLP